MLKKLFSIILAIGAICVFALLAPIILSILGVLLLALVGFGAFCAIVFIIWAALQD